MGTSLGDLRVLGTAERVADEIWQQIAEWDNFAREVVGGQLARAADSIGANIAESFGRFHYGDKIQFLYYARGSLFEAKYWLNRASNRQLMTQASVQDYAKQLTALARQLNAFANSLKTQRQNRSRQSASVREEITNYGDDISKDAHRPLFTEDDFEWLQTIQSTGVQDNATQSISNL